MAAGAADGAKDDSRAQLTYPHHCIREGRYVAAAAILVARDVRAPAEHPNIRMIDPRFDLRYIGDAADGAERGERRFCRGRAEVKRVSLNSCSITLWENVYVRTVDALCTEGTLATSSWSLPSPYWALLATTADALDLVILPDHRPAHRR